MAYHRQLMDINLIKKTRIRIDEKEKKYEYKSNNK